MTHHYSSFDGVVMWSGGQTILRQGQSIDENHDTFVVTKVSVTGSGTDIAVDRIAK